MTYILAEAGTSHADPDPHDRILKAWALIKAAKLAGANAVKFQAFFDEPLFCPVDGDEKRWERWYETFLTEQQWLALHEDAGQIGIDLILSVFSPRGIALLKEMKPRYVKVASRAAMTFPYNELEGPFLVSCGSNEARRAADHLIIPAPWDRSKSSTLQCRMKYPTPLEDSGWGGYHKYHGLSDHSGAIWPGLDAICRGAKFLEVHFTIPGTDPGNDAPVCLSVDQLKLLCGMRDAVATMRGSRGG